MTSETEELLIALLREIRALRRLLRNSEAKSLVGCTDPIRNSRPECGESFQQKNVSFHSGRRGILVFR